MQYAEIIPFPGAPRAAVDPKPGPPQLVPRDPVINSARLGADIGFHELQHRLAMDDAAPRSVIDYVRDLTRAHGFPPPKNPRRWGGCWLRGADAVCRKSKWDRYLVDQWLNGTLPPPAAQAVTLQRHANVRQQLAANAASLATAARA